MPAPLSRTLADFVAALEFDALPGQALDAVRIGMTDTVGVMLSGIAMPLSRRVLATLNNRSANGEARIYLGQERTSVMDATFVNAVTTSSVVFDDVAFTGCHTSAILMPALLAEGERIGASGQRIVCAYAAGYETWARLAERDPDSYSSKGWHATACFGAVASAIALANLRNLDAPTTLRAIGLAAAMSGGITASFDTDVGPFQTARAAAGGVQAVTMAQAGLTAPEDPLERSGRGMLVALSPKGAVDIDRPIDDLGRTWRLETVGINVKQYPFGNIAQRAIDGMLDLVTKHDIKPDDIVKAEMLISDAQYAVVSKSPSVTKFVPSHSIALAAAAAILERRATFAELGEAFYSQPRVQDMMKRIVMVADANIPADTQPNLGFSGGVRLHLASGKMLESPSVDYARGHWTRRMSEDELWRKFSACSAGILDGSKAERLFHDLMTLDKIENVARLNA